MAESPNGILKHARRLRGFRSYVVKTVRRIRGPGNEQGSLPVRALRALFGNYLAVRAEGLPFIVDLRDAVVSYGILADGTWESEMTALMRTLLRPGDHVVDVGAHIGYHTVVCAQAVGSDGKVLALEPASENADLLEINVALNGFSARVQVLRAAAGAQEGSLELVRDAGEGEFAPGVRNRGAYYVRRAESRSSVTVPVTTIDRATAGWNSVSAVKIDVEGYEWHALQGMRRTLAQNADLALFIEFWPGAMRRAGADPAATLAELAQQAFGLWEIKRPGGIAPAEPRELLQRLSGSTDLTDLLCVRGARFANPVAAALSPI